MKRFAYAVLMPIMFAMAMASLAFAVPLAGDYAVGASGTYTTITAAIAALNSQGVSAPVRFLLTDASYVEASYPITVNQITGASATNTITLMPAVGVSATISGSASKSIICLNGTDYFRLSGVDNTRRLTISNTNVSPSEQTAAVWIGSLGTNAGATNNRIEYCNIQCGYNNNINNRSYGVFLGSGGGIFGNVGFAGEDNKNNVIANNAIKKVTRGIYALGWFNSSDNQIDITGNEIGSTILSEQINDQGIYVSDFNTINILNNFISGIVQTITDFGSPIGIFVTQGGSLATASCTINYNVIQNIRITHIFALEGSGIQATQGLATASMQINNNAISDILTNGHKHGIIINSINSNTQILYNSVNLTGSFTREQDNYSVCLFINNTTMTGITVKNNLFMNSLVNTATNRHNRYAIGTFTPSSAFTEINYNNYFTSSTPPDAGPLRDPQLGFRGGIVSGDKANLAAWRAATSQDAQSVSGEVTFSSFATYNLLHVDPANVNSWNVNGRGVAIASIATDIDGDARSTTLGSPTDIGCDEFSPTAEPTPATMSGTIADGQTTAFTSAGTTVAQITWHGSGAITNPTSLPTSVTLKYYPGKLPPPFTSSLPNFINSYWEITTPDGSGFTYDLTLNYTVAEINAIPELNLGIAKRDGGNPWVHQVGAVANNTTKTVFIGGLTSFSQFTLDDNNSPLPIQLASFTATATPNRGVLLRWTTLSEINNYGFYVQRQRQGETAWSEIQNSFIAGHGTTNEPHSYQFPDLSVTRGSWSYRLKQVDMDNTIHFTDAIQVNVLTNVKEVAPIEFSLQQNYPNPFNPTTEIKFSVEKTERAKLEVFNLLGEKVATVFDDVAEAGQFYRVRFDGANLASGMYLYRLQSGKKSELRKFVLLK